MTLYLHKLLPWFALPTALLLCLLLLTLITRQRLWAVLAFTLAWLGSTPMVSNGLMRWCEQGATRLVAADMPQADAIVVLSEGRLTAPGPERSSEWTDGDRFWGGMALFQARKAPKLIFTGGWAPWLPLAPLEGDVLRHWAVAQGVPNSHILTTDRVTTTEEEAKEVARLMAHPASNSAERQPSVLLVTSAYHMPRATRLFEQAGLRALPYPVDFQVDASLAPDPLQWLPQAKYWHQTERAWKELLGRTYYALQS